MKQVSNESREAAPTVRVCIPPAEEDPGSARADQTETVILNGEATVIRRGEYVDVKVPVFEQLRKRYPGL